MHVALVRQRYSAHGGAERFIERALGALSEQGVAVTVLAREWTGDPGRVIRDRKSTRLNSSHLVISYAVFCLKKKKSDRVEFVSHGLSQMTAFAKLVRICVLRL